MSFREIPFSELQINPMTLIGHEWMLVTAGNQEKGYNTMTASWGGLGVLWGQPAATVYIRPQRYTKEFVDREEYFTLSFLPEEYKPQLGICGSKSGRDMDKVKECGFTVKTGVGNAPFFAEAKASASSVDKVEYATLPITPPSAAVSATEYFEAKAAKSAPFALTAL